MIIEIIILILTYCVMRLPFFFKVPNAPAISETKILELVNYYPNPENMYFRVIAYVIGLAVVFLTYAVINKNSEKHLLAFICALFLSFSPWFFILSLFLNVQLMILVVALVIVYFVRNNKIRIILVASLSIFASIPMYLSMDRFNELLVFYDLRTLFFIGDYSSSFLRIPKTGFFLVVDILFVCIGMYAVFFKKFGLKGVVLSLLIGGTITIVMANTIPILRGSLSLLSISILIGCGVYFLSTNINKYIGICIVFLYVLNLIFFLFILRMNFDKKNSSEWLYTSNQIARYVLNNKISAVKITPEASGIESSLKVYLRAIPITIVEGKSMKQLCNNRTILCLGTKDNWVTNKSFTVYNGLPVYYAYEE